MGAILFEMLTDRRHSRANPLARLHTRFCSGSPPALSGSPAIVAMGRIVHRALSREPETAIRAPAMAEELRATLLMDGIETKLARAAALMVLPFRVLRPSEEIEFLAYSLPEAITVSLAGLENLVVRSSIAAARYSGDAPDLQKIAREAEVDVVLTGALLQCGQSNCGLQRSSRKSQAERCSGRTPPKQRHTNCWNFMTIWCAASWIPFCHRSRPKNISRCKRTGPPARRLIRSICRRTRSAGNGKTFRRPLRCTSVASAWILLMRQHGRGWGVPGGSAISTNWVHSRDYALPKKRFRRRFA